MIDYLTTSSKSSETRVLAAISGLWMSRLIGFSVEVGLFESIGEDGSNVEKLSETLGLVSDPLSRALEGLAHLGLLKREGEQFLLTDDGKLLLPDAPGGFCDMALLWSGLFDGAWAEFGNTMRTGEAGFSICHGETIFERLGHDKLSAGRFDRAMRSLSRLISREASPQIAERLKQLHIDNICDIGGGDGHLISEIKHHDETISCHLFDLPDVITRCEKTIKAKGIAMHEGSFFETVPKAQAYILSNIIHDWSDEEAIAILKTVRHAQGDQGRLFLLEMTLGGKNEPVLARSTDLNMLVLTGGRERTVEDLERILCAADYELLEVKPVANLTSLLEVIPVGKNDETQDSKHTNNLASKG